MLADTFTNYGTPERGMASVACCAQSELNVVLTPSIPDGRAAMSQGMIDTARQQARALAAMLQPYLDSGRKIVVVEPSVLAMLRFDNKHLLDDEATIAELAANSFEPLQVLWDIATEAHIDLASCSRPINPASALASSITRTASNGPATQHRRPSTYCAPSALMWSHRRWNVAAWQAASVTSTITTNSAWPWVPICSLRSRLPNETGSHGYW